MKKVLSVAKRAGWFCVFVRQKASRWPQTQLLQGCRKTRDTCVRHQSHTHTYRDGELPHLTDSPEPIRCCGRGTELSYGEVI